MIGYRAPTFSVVRETLWSLEVLAEAGFRYDSSIFPIVHDRYGIPDAPRNFPSEAAGGRHATDFAPGIDAVAIDRSVDVLLVDEAFRHHLHHGAAAGVGTFLWIEIMRWVGAPLPLQPKLARLFGVEIVFNLEAEPTRESLRPGAHDEVMIGLFHHGFSDQRRRAHAFDCGNPALNEWLSRHARQAHASGSARTYVVVDDQRIAGYFSLAVGQIDSLDAPERVRKGMGNYPIPVVILTAHSDDDARRRTLQAGAVAFLGKPFHGEALLGAVRRALAENPGGR